MPYRRGLPGEQLSGHPVPHLGHPYPEGIHHQGTLQVAIDAGAKRILLPMASVRDIPTIPGELFVKFQTAFYLGPQDAVFKALGFL